MLALALTDKSFFLSCSFSFCLASDIALSENWSKTWVFSLSHFNIKWPNESFYMQNKALNFPTIQKGPPQHSSAFKTGTYLKWIKKWPFYYQHHWKNVNEGTAKCTLNDLWSTLILHQPVYLISPISKCYDDQNESQNCLMNSSNGRFSTDKSHVRDIR